MYVKYKPSAFKNGSRQRAVMSEAGQIPNEDDWEPKTSSSVLGWDEWGLNSRTLAPTAHHRVGGVWLATPYVRQVGATRVSTDGEVISKTGLVWFRESGKISTPSQSRMQAVVAPETYAAQVNNLKAAAEVKALLGLSNGDVNLGEALAESRETLGMITSSAVKLGEGIMYMSQGKYRKAAKSLGVSPKDKKYKDISQAWLSLQYGWKPLMADIYGLLEELRKGLNRHQVVTSSAAVSDNTSLDQGHPAGYSPAKTTWSVDIGTEVSITARVSNPTIVKLQSLGLINPAAVIWARVPWSFVVDWFIPVGSILQAYTSASGMVFLTGSRSVRVRASIDTFPIANGSAMTLVSRRPATGTCEALRLERTIYASFPMPSVYSNPHPFSTTRVLNGLALIHQRLSNTRRS